MSCGIFDPAQCALDLVDAINDFSADLFWQLATAPLTLIVIATIAVIAFAVAHFPFVEKFIPVTAPFIASARLVCLVCAGLLIFLIGHRAADQRAELERVKNDLAWTDFQLGEQKKATAEAAELRQVANAETSQAKDKLSAYQEKFGNDPHAAFCAPRPGVIDWLHDLQRRRQDVRAVPAAPERGLVARLRRSGAERR